MRPSTADLLAYQLEQASSPSPTSQRRPAPLSAPPSSKPLSHAANSASRTSQHSSKTPVTPWDDDPASSKAYSKMGMGLGLSAIGNDHQESSPRRQKLQGRGGVSKARVEEEEEEETDDDLEDELNDFGYGSTRKRKEKKESLMDLLNSEPPSWMVQDAPVPVSIPPKPNSSFQHKLRTRFSSTHVPDEAHAGLTTLHRGGSSSRSNTSTSKKENQNPLLRSSRSAGNLLGTLRSRISGAAATNRSRDDLVGLPTPVEPLPSSASTLSRSAPPYRNDPNEVDEFGRIEPSISASMAISKRLTAKEATSTTTTTRDLADFLRTSAPTTISSPPPLLPANSQSSLLSLANTETTTKSSSSLTGLTQSTNSLDGGARGGGSSSGSHSGASIVRAAMIKVAGAGRRASLGSATSFQQLVSKGGGGISERPLNGSNSSSEIPTTRLHSFRYPSSKQSITRPTTGQSTQSTQSEESMYDPMNKETIQVDESLMRGMFGRNGKSETSLNGSGGGGLPYDLEEEEELQETLRDRESSVEVGGGGGGTDKKQRQLGVYEFVEIDERESGGMSPEPHQIGPSLTKSWSTGDVPISSGIAIARKDSFTSTRPVSKIISPRRKPVPLVQATDENSSPSSTPPSRRSYLSKESIAAIKRLQEREDTSPLAVGESPIKGHEPVSSLLAPFSSLVRREDDLSPTSPNESYSTPPMTPSTPRTSSTLRSGIARPSTAPTSLQSKRISIGSIPTSSRIVRPLSPVLDDTIRTTSPPPHPIESTPPSSSASRRRESTFRPRTILLKPSSPDPSSPPRKLSTLRRNATLEESPRSTTTTTTSTTDSPLDPTHVDSRRIGTKEDKVDDDSIFDALDALRSCLYITSNLSIDLSSSSSTTSSSVDLLRKLVPTLKGLQEGMVQGAQVIEVLIERIEREGSREDGRRKPEEEEGGERGGGGSIEFEDHQDESVIVVETLLNGDMFRTRESSSTSSSSTPSTSLSKSSNSSTVEPGDEIDEGTSKDAFDLRSTSSSLDEGHDDRFDSEDDEVLVHNIEAP